VLSSVAPLPQPLDDYLCCIGRGLIQFVCVREGRWRSSSPKNASYRSLTADKIIIHPGSVMFRTDPQFIVAGEIVRTSKIYAMSVSPLSREILERIRPGLFASERWEDTATDSRRDKRSRATEERTMLKTRPVLQARDFTNNIKIATEVFELATIKGRKTAILPWEKLVLIRDSIPSETVYKGLKGCITINGVHTLLAGEKLKLILSLAPLLDPENALTREWPRKQNFNSSENLAGNGIATLLPFMDSLLRPARWKKNSKELGFIALFTDGEGNYWLRCSRGFHTSLNESLASLEALIDEMGDDVDIGLKHIVNQAYRRLSDLLVSS
jgi:hypothetical protein